LSKVFFRSERIVRAAPELEVVERRRSAEGVGETVVNLEPEGFATSLTAVVLVSASPAVPFEHRTAYGRRNVTSSAPLRRGTGYAGSSLRRGIGYAGSRRRGVRCDA
jgi:hypothetical protein